jgi:formate hydrogenlyase subunit 4
MVFQYFNEALGRTETAFSMYSTVIISLLIAVALVYFAAGESNITSVLVTLLVAALIFLLITSARGDDPQGALPTTTYPIPPHLGLGAVNLQNWWPRTPPHVPA